MYSQAYVRAGKCVAHLPIRALPSVIVDTEKGVAGSGWAHEARGPEASNEHMGGKVFAPWCTSKAGLVSW